MTPRPPSTPPSLPPSPAAPDPSSPDPLAAVRKAAAGLLYPSESDEPIVPFAWPASAGASARAAVAGRERAGTPIEEVSAADFFAALEGTDDAARFAALRKALEAAVAGLTVLRAGEVRVAIYVTGKLPGPAGGWAGVRTTSAET